MTNLLELYLKLVFLVLVGYILGRRLSTTVPTRLGQFLFWVGVPIGINPALWSFGFGLLFREVKIPTPVEFWLELVAWSCVALSLVLIGMRLSQLTSWHNLPRASASIGIKMLLVPLILGSILPLFGLTGTTARAIVLQMAMPPAFATLVIAETFNLDRDLAVTSLAMGSMVLLVTLPIWLWLF